MKLDKNMLKKSQIKTISIDKLVNPWGGDEKTKQEVQSALSQLSDDPKEFMCKKCGVNHKPKPFQWIFYNLCDICFKEFDTQKMKGRRATLKDKDRVIKHLEDVDEWIKQTTK